MHGECKRHKIERQRSAYEDHGKQETPIRGTGLPMTSLMYLLGERQVPSWVQERAFSPLAQVSWELQEL